MNDRRTMREARRERLLAKLGTIAHNRRFSPAEFREAGGTDGLLTAFVREGLVERVEKGQYFPTPAGWLAIEEAVTWV